MDITIYKAGKTATKAPEKREHIPDAYKKVAKGMEQQFVEFMINEMDKTAGKMDHSMAGKYYRSLLNTERAKIMTEVNGGMGLQDMILDQIYPKNLRQKKGGSYE